MKSLALAAVGLGFLPCFAFAQAEDTSTTARRAREQSRPNLMELAVPSNQINLGAPRARPRFETTMREKPAIPPTPNYKMIVGHPNDSKDYKLIVAAPDDRYDYKILAPRDEKTPPAPARSKR